LFCCIFDECPGYWNFIKLHILQIYLVTIALLIVGEIVSISIGFILIGFPGIWHVVKLPISETLWEAFALYVVSGAECYMG